MFRCLVFLIGLFAIMSVLPKTAEVFAQPAPAQAQGEPAQTEVPAKLPPQNEARPLAAESAPAPGSPNIDTLNAAVQALDRQIKQISEAITRERGAAPAGGVAPAGAAAPAGASAPAGGAASNRLDRSVAIAAFIVLGICLLGALFVWRGRRDQSRATAEKDLEGQRISYGFWLVIGALLITFLVLVVTLTALAPQEPKTTDVVAIIGSVTGVIGTLTAAFFGIQAAGAGRSQAMTALSDHLKTQESLNAPGKFEPNFGPHSGGTRISITGNGFTGANGANFGVTPGVNFEFVNDGLVRANSPLAPDGVDEAKINLIFPGSTPPNREVGTFYFYTIEPCRGAAGQIVTIRGSGLKDVKTVKFGKAEAAVPAAGRSARELKVPTPPKDKGDANDVDVTLIFPVEAPTNFFVVGKYRYESAPQQGAGAAQQGVVTP
jgi:uncharacterized Tic20 family protein